MEINFHVQYFARTNSDKETFFKYFASFVKKTFHLLPFCFCMRLNASLHKANQKKIKETEMSFRRFVSSFFLLSSLDPGI